MLLSIVDGLFFYHYDEAAFCEVYMDFDHDMVAAVRDLFRRASSQPVQEELVQQPADAETGRAGQFWLCWTTSHPPTAEDMEQLVIASHANAIVQIRRVEEVVGSHPQGGIVIVRWGW